MTKYDNRKAVEKVDRPIQEHCAKGDYRIPSDRHQLVINDLSFWLTPLRSAMSKAQTAEYYVLARHNKLRVHGKRVVAFIYSPGTKLRWI